MSDSTDQTEYRGPEIPTPLGDQLQLALGLDERPETFGDWVNALALFADRSEHAEQEHHDGRDDCCGTGERQLVEAHHTGGRFHLVRVLIRGRCTHE
jgi:hypothetical protein